MKTNVGGIDRGLRLIAGVILVALTLTGTIGLWGWIGAVPILTALIGFCPEHLLRRGEEIVGFSPASFSEDHSRSTVLVRLPPLFTRMVPSLCPAHQSRASVPDSLPMSSLARSSRTLGPSSRNICVAFGY